MGCPRRLSDTVTGLRRKCRLSLWSGRYHSPVCGPESARSRPERQSEWCARVICYIPGSETEPCEFSENPDRGRTATPIDSAPEDRFTLASAEMEVLNDKVFFFLGMRHQYSRICNAVISA